MDPQAQNLSMPDSPPPPPMPKSEIKKDNHWITILSMAVFVLLSLGAVAFLYYQNQQLKTMLAGYQTKSTPSPTADPTANWKIYTNSSFNFSLKYPESLVLENFYDSKVALPDKNVLFGFEFRDSTTKLDVINFTIYKSGDKNLSPSTPKDAQKIAIGDLNVTEFQDSASKFFRYTDSEARIFQLQILNLNPQREATANQILSTFKFLGQNQTTDPTLELIKSLTPNVSWSSEQNGSIVNSSGKNISGILITTSDTDPKIRGILSGADNTPLVANYGWTWDQTQSGDGVDGSINTLRKGSQELIVRYSTSNGYIALITNAQ